MFKFSHLLVVGGALAIGATAHAEPNMPRRATTMRVELVRAYEQCTVPDPGDGLRNSSFKVCSAQSESDFKFGKRGHGRASVRMGDARGNFLVLQLDLRDVKDSADKSVDGQSFWLACTYRITANYCEKAGVCTTTDIDEGDLYVEAPCHHGRCSHTGDFDFGGILAPAFDANIEIVQMKVLDPSKKNVFAVPGIGRNSSN